MLIQRQPQKSPYTNVFVLLLQWEETKEDRAEEREEEDDEELPSKNTHDHNAAVDPELAALEQVLHERYNYCTERWSIPAVSSASLKLGVRIQKFLEKQARDHLLIVYYAGRAYVGEDSQVFWLR
jgi:hypothetical protein